jgi:DNA-binding protein HU-beta
MNKQGLIAKVAEKAELTKKESAKLVDAVFESVLEGLLEDGEAVLGDLGKLQVVKRAARKARNPLTNEEILVPEKNAPKFKPSKHLKNSVS